jgi:hypothetical protein
MGSTNLSKLQRRARWAYEFSRLRYAILGVVPVGVILALAACLTHRLTATLWFGAAAILVGAVMLWYGRDPQKAVLPGVAAGLVPLVLALCASHFHACGATGCSSLCVPACTLGGIVAGLTIASIGNRRHTGPLFWLCASALALLTGAMGCTCIGYSGVLGLWLGFMAGLVPGLLRRALGRNPS